jgi:pimeloyl-ACP methyl ester carboxylesterase
MKHNQMLHWIIILMVIIITNSALSQTYGTGNTSATFNDPDRNNRSITTQIFYPANSNGTNVPVAEGEFPVIVFGHGFVMGYSAYQYLWQALVPQGYILVLPTTESGFSPNHLALGLDLRFLVGKLKAESLNPSSLFYNHISEGSAIMGHSMGGGASFLACQNFSDVSAMITFAAAETNPSAIQAAASIQVPTLVFSGSNDCVTPPPNHQVPMYNNLASDCKTFISITGGGHCYFADYNFNCAFGELTCSPSPTITRDQQHAIILNHLVPYLEFHLKGNQQAWITFNNLLNNPTGITSLQSCNIRLINVKAFLEGPFNGTNMNTYLTGLTDFPLSQPYNVAPWNYLGSEIVTTVPSNVVDWILVELRDATSAATATPATSIDWQAAFLMNDGSILGLDGTLILQFSNSIIQQLFVVIWHRNHLAIISANPLTESGGVYSYDFTSGTGQAYNGGQKEIALGVWGMFAGDTDASGLINENDRNPLWNQWAGETGYLYSDFNMNTQINNRDKNDFWLSNVGKSCQVPQ